MGIALWVETKPEDGDHNKKAIWRTVYDVFIDTTEMDS